MKVKHVIILFAAMVFAASAVIVHAGPTKEIKVGDMTKVTGSYLFITVRNLSPIDNGGTVFEFGNSCIINQGATIEAVALDKNRVLARFISESKQLGTNYCPKGTIFFITKDSFFQMEAQRQEAERTEQREKNLVRKLLKNSHK